MLAGAERQTRIDLEIDGVGGPVGIMHRRMHEEAAGADRLQSLLAFRHPVGGIFEMLDLRLARSKLRQLGDFDLGWLSIEVGMKQPFVRLVRIGLVRDEHRGSAAVREQVTAVGYGLGLSARAREGDPPAHLAASFASRSSSLLSRPSA